MRGEVHILVYCPIDTLQWGSTHSGLMGVVVVVSQLKIDNQKSHNLVL